MGKKQVVIVLKLGLDSVALGLVLGSVEKMQQQWEELQMIV